MAQVQVSILGRQFVLACGDGEEERVRGLAARVEERVRAVAGPDTRAPDARVMLLAAIMLANEGEEADRALEGLRAEMDKVRRSADRSAAEVDATLSRALDEFASRIEGIASRLEGL